MFGMKVAVNNTAEVLRPSDVFACSCGWTVANRKWVLCCLYSFFYARCML